MTAWTAGQLRQAMEGLPDDLPVSLLVSQEPGGEFADEQVVISAAPWSGGSNATAEDVRRRLAGGELQPERPEISLGSPSGQYYPRRAASGMVHENDGRLADESPVLVRCPLEGRGSPADRETWPWLPGTIEQPCGPDESLVTIEDRRLLAELEDGTAAPEGTSDEDLLFPHAHRDSSELRAVPKGIARLADSPGFRMLIADLDQADLEAGQ
jgi:hypothetical protein